MKKPSRTKRLIHRMMAFDRVGRSIQVEEIPLTCPGLPQEFHHARVAVVADLHLPDQLISLPQLLTCLKEQQPDAIVLPGDLTNSYTDFDADGLTQLAQELVQIAPCFAVPGNHEWRLEREPLYRQILAQCGIHYLCDAYADWQHNGASLRLWGAGQEDPHVPPVQEHPAILLAHHPEYFPDYKQAGWDLVICGHAHGGHVRMGRWSLFSPDQGFFPKYTHSLYQDGTTRMVVSRGLGNSSLPWRINNPPHLPLLILTTE